MKVARPFFKKWPLWVGVSVLAAAFAIPASAQENPAPVRIGLTAEYGLRNSVSAQAVEMGIRAAIHEINAAGGVLGGRPLALKTQDDRSVPARAIRNVKDFAAMDDMVAVFGARFSPVLIELLPIVHKLGVILLDPWASADIITNHEYSPNFCFRLSLKDRLAMPAMLGHAKKRGLKRAGLLLPNTAWGRSNEEAALAHAAHDPDIRIAKIRWYNWGDASLLEPYRDLLDAGADVLVLVANDREGSILLKEMAALPEDKRLPVLSHWGVTGGRFVAATEGALEKIDFAVVQTFSFFWADPAVRDRFMKMAKELYDIESYETIRAPVGVGHAYDLTHLLARAIDKAGTTDRAAIRTALEHLGPYRGLVANLARPFTPEDHDALGPDAVFMARYRADGVLIPIND